MFVQGRGTGNKQRSKERAVGGVSWRDPAPLGAPVGEGHGRSLGCFMTRISQTARKELCLGAGAEAGWKAAGSPPRCLPCPVAGSGSGGGPGLQNPSQCSEPLSTLQSLPSPGVSNSCNAC